jgi:gas vesicle protein
MILDPLSIFLGLLAGALVAALIMGALLMRAEKDKAGLVKDLEHERAGREELGNLFSLTAQEALKQNSEQFLERFGELAQEKIKQAKTETAHELEK